MCSRKDYETAARLCAEMLHEGFSGGHVEFARRFFSQDNPRFKPKLFIKRVREEFLKIKEG